MSWLLPGRNPPSPTAPRVPHAKETCPKALSSSAPGPGGACRPREGRKADLLELQNLLGHPCHWACRLHDPRHLPEVQAQGQRLSYIKMGGRGSKGGRKWFAAHFHLLEAGREWGAETDPKGGWRWGRRGKGQGKS